MSPKMAVVLHKIPKWELEKHLQPKVESSDEGFEDFKHKSKRVVESPRKRSRTFGCSICNEEFSMKNSLIEHMSNVHESFIDDNSDSESDFNETVTLEGDTDEESLNESTAEETESESDIQEITDENENPPELNVVCDHCDRGFANQRGLKMHQTMVHKIDKTDNGKNSF